MPKLYPLVVSSIATIGLLAVAAPAIAQPQQEIVITGKALPPGHEPVQTTVKIGDLNLATSEGVSQMEKRVSAAINTLCVTPAASRTIAEKKESDSCTKYAWGTARPQMNSAIKAARGS